MRSSIRKIRVCFLRVSLLIVLTTTLAAEEPFTIRQITMPAADLPPKLVAFLSSSGVRVTTFVNGLETTVAEVFWANSISLGADVKHSPGLLYPSLVTGQLMGLIHYPAGGNQEYREDFRDQKLRPGYYSMRYARIPADKQHHNIAAYRDFILLSPIQADRSPEVNLDSQQLIQLSRIATRTKHPAVLSLVPADGTQSEGSSLRPDDAGRWILQVNLHTRSATRGLQGQLLLALILVTPIQENGGS